MNDAGNPLNIALDNSTSVKYKASLLGRAIDADGNDRLLKKIFRSLELPLINCKVHLELNWNNKCMVLILMLVVIMLTIEKQHSK